MTISLKKHHAEWITEQVRAGRYASDIEAIEDAIAGKIEADEIERLRARLANSIAQVERGEVVKADDAFFERLRERIDQVGRGKG